jgi:acyl carrier protein
MLEQFLEIMADVIEVELESVGRDTRFREVADFDSLCALSTIAAVDDLFSYTLTAEQLENVNTLGELFDLVTS